MPPLFYGDAKNYFELTVPKLQPTKKLREKTLGYTHVSDAIFFKLQMEAT